MPIYEYHCAACRRRVSILWRDYQAAQEGQPRCPRCRSTELRRVFSRVSVIRGAGDIGGDDFDLPSMGDLDENDPRSIARWMRQMSDSTGEDLGEEFNEAIGRLEAGQSPEEIEAAMPELSGEGTDLPDDLD